MRFRWIAIAVAMVLIAGACGSSGGNSANNSNDLGGGGTTSPAAGTRPASCSSATLTSPEVGIDSKTITVTVVADTGSQIKPGLFQGSIDAVKAWGNYINDNGGLACRNVVVKTADSKLSAQDAQNAIVAACSNSIALVGTTALFFQDQGQLENCKDKTGKATGLPDIAELQTDPTQQCSKLSFATLPTGSSCPYSGTGPRTFSVGQTQYDYYKKTFPGLALHGVFTIPKDLTSTIASTMPIFRAENQLGIKSDAEFGISGLATQADYTPVVAAIKQHSSNYARNGLDYSGTVLERKEAQAQGVNSVKIWDCSVQCYDKRLISVGGSATENQYVWLNILPMEDGAGANAELGNFLKYDKKPDGFGEQAWVAGEIFAQAVKDTMAAHNDDPNSITRVNLLAALNGLHSFDANGMIPKEDVGAHKGSTCLVGMQVQNGKFVRIDPTQSGQFDCDDNKPAISLTIDPLKEYHG
jgi:Periplasmic binding protein